MILLANIIEGAALFGAGAALTAAILWWLQRNSQRARDAEIQAALDKARSEAESLKREAAAAASQETLRLRAETEASFATQRAERLESERRLASHGSAG